MTREEIDALDLDDLNTECAKALGWKDVIFNGYALAGHEPTNREWVIVPDYSRDIGAAWELWRWIWDNKQLRSLDIICYSSTGTVAVNTVETTNPDDIPAMICRAFLYARNNA
jgi:hypothetical protein